MESLTLEAPHGRRSRSSRPTLRVGGWAAATAALAALVGCSGGAPEPVAGPHPVRFVVEADGREPGPVYVQINTESRPVGWLTLLRDGEPLAFAPRCEVPRCGEPAEAVCGAALPQVQELTVEGAGEETGPDPAVEYVWDGHLSRTTEEGCQLREPAPAGAYMARVCYARAMERFGSGGGPGGGAELGHVRDPVCVERSLNVPGDNQLRVTVPPR